MSKNAAAKKSDTHITADDIVISVDESPEMRAANSNVGAIITARLNIRYSYKVSDEEWHINRQMAEMELTKRLRQALLRQLYGDVWLMATAVAHFMAADTPAARFLNYAGARWLELLRNIGRVRPEAEKTSFQEYPMAKPPELSKVLLPEPGEKPPVIPVEPPRIVLATGGFE